MTPEDFADACAATIGRPFDGGLAVAVSGGPDSLALLLLAHAAYGDAIVALTVDHGLRAASVAEAAMVADVCAARGVPHATLAWCGDKPSANLQAAARDARYALMAGHCAAQGIRWLATGHHADDQAETLLMRLARGSGAGWLSGIRRVRELGSGVTLLRPLLGVRRAALRAVVIAAGLTAIDDPANRDPRHDRTAARTVLAATPWLDAVRLSDAAAHLAEADAALEWTAALAWDSRAKIGDPLAIDVADLPAEVRRRLVVRALAHFGATARGPAINRMIERLNDGGSATLGSIQARAGDKWTFRRARARL